LVLTRRQYAKGIVLRENHATRNRRKKRKRDIEVAFSRFNMHSNDGIPQGNAWEGAVDIARR
jgi:hypothetical protein